jgi:hypothetical protein
MGWMTTKIDVKDRWNALIRYDDELRAAAEELRSFGEAWVNELGRAYFALNEDRSYLPNIVTQLRREAERKREEAERDALKRWEEM